VGRGGGGEGGGGWVGVGVIGDQGGGPSKIDLEAINEYMKVSDSEIVHSSTDDYFNEIDKENLPVVEESLIPSMIGCYTSMVRIKQANRRLENKLAVTEKIMSYAQMTTDFEYDNEELKKAKKALAFCQFHDVLPGSSIKPVEEDCLATLSYGEDIADKLYARAFFKMCEGQKVAKSGEIPVMVFNPHPFPVDGEFEIGFMLENQNWNEGEQTLAVVYDSEGNALPTQNEKPDCTFNLDWIQKVSFKATIEPSSVTRFDCKLKVYKSEEIEKPSFDGDYITVENDRMTARISKKTGNIYKQYLDKEISIIICKELNIDYKVKKK
jgi:alpha-mannosidase